MSMGICPMACAPSTSTAATPAALHTCWRDCREGWTRAGLGKLRARHNDVRHRYNVVDDGHAHAQMRVCSQRRLQRTDKVPAGGKLGGQLDLRVVMGGDVMGDVMGDG